MWSMISHIKQKSNKLYLIEWMMNELEFNMIQWSTWVSKLSHLN